MVADEDRAPEIMSGMLFWIDLDRQLAGDVGESGVAPRRAIDYLLTEVGIVDEIDRDVARQMLERIAIGRNKARNERIEPEKPLKNA